MKLHAAQSVLCAVLAAFLGIALGVAHREPAQAATRPAVVSSHESTVFGYLVYRSGDPVGGGEIMLVDSTGRRRAATHTDAFGYFETKAEPATYTIRAAQRGAHVAKVVAVGPGVHRLDLPRLERRPTVDDTSKLWGLAQGVVLFLLGYTASASSTWRRRRRLRAFILGPVVASLADALPAFDNPGAAGRPGSEVLGLLEGALSTIAPALSTKGETLAADDPRLWRVMVDLRDHLGQLVSVVEPRIHPEVAWRRLRADLAGGREPNLRAVLQSVRVAIRRAKRLVTGRLVA